jgi:2-oxoglutarate ferredoxin oxidoreductase subunit alpha
MGTKQLESLDTVVIRFAGDSGDGMQITGSQFTNTAALLGNDLATFPDFPAEIRAPAGTLPGVSGFQVNFASKEIHTPGDDPDVLVAMNPAALKVNLKDLPQNGILVADTDAFDRRNLGKAGYEESPLEDGSLAAYRLFAVPLTTMTETALREIEELTTKEKRRCKNFFALGMMYWLFSRKFDTTVEWLEKKFAKRPVLAKANSTALKAGYAYCDASEEFQVRYKVHAAPSEPGLYKNVNGNEALALGLVAASVKADVPIFYGSYPITPASAILHALARHKNFGVVTFQAEDEIAAIGSAIGASFGGALGVTGTSGPGIALKGEALGLAVMVELPLVVINVQRAGPSTGMPTKTEQADLVQACYGRNGEAPMPIFAPSSPSDCFEVAFEAARVAIKHMVPVMILSDGYIANGAEPWRMPRTIEDLPEVPVAFFEGSPDSFEPFGRDEKTLARPWVRPGTPELEHRIGGLEKADKTGNVSYDPANHQLMTDLRQEKVDRVAAEFPAQEVYGDESGDLLVIGWGGTYGAIHSAVQRARNEGLSVSQVHLRHLNPFPRDLGDILARFGKVLVPELNMGQLSMMLRSRYLVDAIGLNKVEGQPFKVREIIARIRELVG